MSCVVPRDRCTRVFDPDIEPVLTVDPGTVVTFETNDLAYERLARGEPLESFGPGEFNLVTGPVAIRTAEPGDALCVEVLDIRIDRAWTVWVPGFGPLGHRTSRLEIQQLDVAGGRVRISPRLDVPLEPMIGCIGVAPARGQGSTIAPAYPFGGNMDLREMSAGATLYLPVQVSGGLLSLGDLHAAMGVGEPTSMSLEASGAATVRIGVDKRLRLAGPRLRVEGQTLCVAIRDDNGTLEQARRQATDMACDCLIQEHGLAPFEAYAYACAMVGVRFGGPASAIVVAVIPDP